MIYLCEDPEAMKKCFNSTLKHLPKKHIFQTSESVILELCIKSNIAVWDVCMLESSFGEVHATEDMCGLEHFSAC